MGGRVEFGEDLCVCVVWGWRVEEIDSMFVWLL